MKKRFGLVILSVLFALACALTFVACGPSDDDEGRTVRHDGTYYLYENGGLDYESSITISRGKVTASTDGLGFDFGDEEDGIKVSITGSVTSSSITYKVTATGSQEGMSMKTEATVTGSIGNGVIHFTEISSKTTANGAPLYDRTEPVDFYFCMEGRTPADIEGGGSIVDGEAGLSRDNPLSASVDTNYVVSASNRHIWYSFTPSETKNYIIESKDYSGDPKINLYWDNEYEFNDDGGENYNFRITKTLTAGTTYYMEVYGGEFTFSIRALPAGSSRENAVVASVNTDYNVDTNITGGEHLWYSFTPTVTQAYVIESRDYRGDPRINLHWGSSSQSNDDGGENYNFRIAKELTVGTTYYIEVYGGEFTFSVRPLDMTRADATPITISSETNTATIRAVFEVNNQHIWYSITPTVTGTCKFYSNSNNNAFNVYIGQEQTPILTNSGVTSSSLDLRYEFTAGTTYYIEFIGTHDTGTWSVNVEMCDGSARSLAVSAQLNVQYNVNIATGDNEVWYVFRPTVRGRYVIQSSDSTDDPYCVLYTGNDSNSTTYDDNSAGGNDFRIVRVLEANTNYFILASMASPTGVGIYKLTITPADGGTRDTAIIAASDADYTVAPTSDHPVWLEFTAPVSGDYVIRSTGTVGDPALDLYTGSNSSPSYTVDDGGSGNNFLATRSLSSNTTYYLAVKQLSSTAQGSYTVRIISPEGTMRANPIGVVLGIEYSKSNYNSNASAWYAFTPATSGTYVMRTIGNYSGDPKGELYEEDDATRLAYDDDGGVNYNFLIRYDLTAGTTYYIRVYGTSAFTFVWQRADGSDRALSLNAELNTPYSVRITSSDQEMWFAYTTTSSGNYTFSSNAAGDCDPICYLYSGTSTSSSASDDNGGVDNNFNLVYNLNSNTTYYIRLKVVDGAIGNFTFTVRKPDGASRDTAYLLYANGREYEVRFDNSNQTVWYAFVPYVSGKYTFESVDALDWNINATLYQGNSTGSLATTNNIGGNDRNFRLQYSLIAGTTYYLEISSAQSSTIAGAFGLRVVDIPGTSRDNPLEAEANMLFYVNADSANTVVWYTFIPTVTAEYTIYSTNNRSCDPYLTVYQGNSVSSLATDNDGGANNNFSLTRTLEADTTYYIAVSLARGSSIGTYYFAITNGSGTTRGSAIVASAGASYNFVFTGGDSNTNSSSKWLVFTPTVSGSYTLRAVTNESIDEDMKVYIGNSSSNDSSLSDTQTGHINKSVTLTADTAYYIELYVYHGNGSLTFSITHN